MEQFIYFRRLPEAVPILKDESTPGKIVATANGRIPDDPREEDIQPESTHPSTRAAIAQVSLSASETSYFYVMDTVIPFHW
jgi:hypothetical protein